MHDYNLKTSERKFNLEFPKITLFKIKCIAKLITNDVPAVFEL